MTCNDPHCPDHAPERRDPPASIEDRQGMGASSNEDRATAAEPVVSALRDGIPSAIVLVRADDPDQKPQLYACPKCGSVHSPRIYACKDDVAHETARKAAEDCYNCREHNTCSACGCECPKSWTMCADCREAKKLAEAIEVDDDGGPYFEFLGDRMYYALSEAAHDGVEWVSPCTETYPRMDADSVLENLLDDMHEDASVDDLDGTEAFRAAVETFNAAQTTQTYWADVKRKIRVPAQGIEAAEADETANAGSAVGESPVTEGHAPEGGRHG